MDNNEEQVVVEAITLKQFAQSLAGQEVRGTPVGIAYPVIKREQVSGQEPAKHRVRISFDFDVTCNSGPILNSHNDDDIKAHDLALLKSFLVANRGKLLDMMVDRIVSKLAWHPEAFLEDFLPQLDLNTRTLFKPAIEALDSKEKQYWHRQEEETDNGLTDWFNYCTEGIFNCFEATFIKSSYEIVSQDKQAS